MTPSEGLAGAFFVLDEGETESPWSVSFPLRSRLPTATIARNRLFLLSSKIAVGATRDVLGTVMAQQFNVTVTTDDWDSALSAWRCSAVCIPGAKVDKLFASGNLIDPAWYQADDKLGVIYWVRGGEPPAAAKAVLKLTKELSEKDLSPGWRKVSILVPIIAAALGTGGILTYIPAHLTGCSSKQITQPPSGSNNPTTPAKSAGPAAASAPNVPGTSYNAVLERLAQGQPRTPYAWVGYDYDLNGLANSLNAFSDHVDQVQKGGRAVTPQELNDFENRLIAAVGKMQSRCFTQLGPIDNAVNLRFHCDDHPGENDTLGQFETIVDWQWGAMQTPDHRLSQAWIEFLRVDIDHWLKGALVFPGQYPVRPPLPSPLPPNRPFPEQAS
jgi:hypothetical protein